MPPGSPLAHYSTGDTTSKTLKYDGAQIMYVTPLDAFSPLTQDAVVGFVLRLDGADGAARWSAHGYNAYDARGDFSSSVTRYGNSILGVALSGVRGGVFVAGFFTNSGKLMSGKDGGNGVEMSSSASSTFVAPAQKRWYVAHVEADGRVVPEYLGKEVVAETNFGVRLPLIVDEFPTALSTVKRLDGSVLPLLGGYAQTPSVGPRAGGCRKH